MANKKKMNASTNSTSKKSRARVEAAKQRRGDEITRLVTDPSRYYQFHMNYELMLYLIHMLDNTQVEMEDSASVIFYNEGHAYKDMLKANTKAIETIRTDVMIFKNPDSEEGEMEYIQAIREASTLRNLLRTIVEIIHIKGETGLTQIESTLKLLLTPSIIKANRVRVADGVIANHKHDFDPEIMKIWTKFKDDMNPVTSITNNKEE